MTSWEGDGIAHAESGGFGLGNEILTEVDVGRFGRIAAISGEGAEGSGPSKAPVAVDGGHAAAGAGAAGAQDGIVDFDAWPSVLGEGGGVGDHEVGSEAVH